MRAFLLILIFPQAFASPTQPTNRCQGFLCSNGRCIPETWKCDGEKDCEDGSDESLTNCNRKVCLETEFECEFGLCMPISWMCDGQRDCPNGLDERNCSVTCRGDEFKCRRDASCIQKLWVCDGDSDCEDGSDEEQCNNKECRSSDFQCKDKHCISRSWRCDGEFDCPDHSDEQDCPNQHLKSSSVCLKDEYLCNDRFTCIPNHYRCDGAEDCPDGDDESPDYCRGGACREEEFRCTNGHCIPKYLHCNGESDCDDGSDEQHCPGRAIKCVAGEFDCGGKKCLDKSQVCDGKVDCPDGEDEPAGKCNVNECLIDNGGCPDICIDTPTSHECACQPGYKFTLNFTCQDIDECENPGSCSHKCINEKGTFKCECFEGYTKDLQDKTRCKPTEGRTYLLFTRKHDIRGLSADRHQMTSIVNNTKSATALDYIYRTGVIFWSDVFEHRIYKAPIDGGHIQTVVINNELISCDGLAIDWIYNHIYWTDTGKNTIEVANLDGSMRKALFDSRLDEPRSIAVNPLDGWLYWSDWGIEGKIERAGLDGSNRQVIVSFDVKWPNGITLDLVRKRLYWVDAKLNTISSVNYDGSDRRLILKSSKSLKHPFSISVFEDFVYWTDWDNTAIFRANKFNGANVTAVTAEVKVEDLMVVHAYHPYRQPNGTNYCELSPKKCSHLCLPAPQIDENATKFSCLCPEGFVLEKNGLDCIEKEISRPEIENKTMEAIPHRAQEKLSTNENKTEEATLLTPQERQSEQEEHYNKAIMPIVIVSVSFFLLFTSLVAYVIYRNYLQKTIISMNFDNPVYRKTTEDRVSLVQIHRQTSSKRKDEIMDGMTPLVAPN